MKLAILETDTGPKIVASFPSGMQMTEVFSLYERIKQALESDRVSRIWHTESLVGSREIAENWNIGESTFRQLVQTGDMPSPLEERGARGMRLWDAEAVEHRLRAQGYTLRQG